jgi:hypothetical protein
MSGHAIARIFEAALVRYAGYRIAGQLGIAGVVVVVAVMFLVMRPHRRHQYPRRRR